MTGGINSESNDSFSKPRSLLCFSFQAKIGDLLELSVKYTASVCSHSKVLWQLLHPDVRADLSSDDMRQAIQDARSVVQSDGQVDEERLQLLKVKY